MSMSHSCVIKKRRKKEMPWAGGQKSRLKEMESVPPGGRGKTCVFLPPAHPA